LQAFLVLERAGERECAVQVRAGRAEVERRRLDAASVTVVRMRTSSHHAK